MLVACSSLCVRCPVFFVVCARLRDLYCVRCCMFFVVRSSLCALCCVLFVECNLLRALGENACDDVFVLGGLIFGV